MASEPTRKEQATPPDPPREVQAARNQSPNSLNALNSLGDFHEASNRGAQTGSPSRMRAGPGVPTTDAPWPGNRAEDRADPGDEATMLMVSAAAGRDGPEETKTGLTCQTNV